MLNEIFKTNPKLLEEPEVKNLIEYVQKQHERSLNITNKYIDFHSKVWEKCMYSEVMLIKGKKSKETINEILQLLNDF